MNLYYLFLLLIIIPFVEIYLFITVGQWIGVVPTLLIVFFTAIIGAYLLHTQGLATINKAQTMLQQGQIPTEPLLEGLFLLVGGVLLLTPGFFTDTLGLICLIPYSRWLLVLWLKRQLRWVTIVPPTEVTVHNEDK
ncbi:MAG: hypothetical protein BWK79_05245 [Beggiatoa sp. IS2]|nr:MAG: hypothetical protein BWK79_05245 [Beggiatoa sp. IS2]